jgi:hypothetical protein
MPGGRLLLVGGVVALLIVVLVVGTVLQILGNSFRNLNQARDRSRKERDSRPPAVSRPDPIRYTPRRTRLRWYSPALIAVLLLSLAAGLWLARLVG